MVSKELASVEAISVKVSIKDIASLIGSVCESSYGVIGLTDVKDVRNTFATILNKENYVEGIFFSYSVFFSSKIPIWLSFMNSNCSFQLVHYEEHILMYFIII